jgi:hypothetical protein
MSIVLPTEPVKASRINPKILIIYSLPKVGKTDMLSQLPGNLILDGEDGAAYYDCLKLTLTNEPQIDEICKSIRAEGAKRAAAGKKGVDIFPYPYISLDTVDAFEEMCEITCTKEYKDTVIGKNWEGSNITDLPQGAGYGLVRRKLMTNVLKLASVCKTLIITSHIKDKSLNKGGVEATFKDISLSGKLGGILCSKADAIGYVYRNKDSELWINFESMEDSAVMGGRCPHLKGKNMPFEWSSIFVPEN